ncbi:MAG TPA: hypothetical protein VF489_02880 [Sphingobium sp.]
MLKKRPRYIIAVSHGVRGTRGLRRIDPRSGEPWARLPRPPLLQQLQPGPNFERRSALWIGLARLIGGCIDRLDQIVEGAIMRNREKPGKIFSQPADIILRQQTDCDNVIMSGH